MGYKPAFGGLCAKNNELCIFDHTFKKNNTLSLLFFSPKLGWDLFFFLNSCAIAFVRVIHPISNIYVVKFTEFLKVVHKHILYQCEKKYFKTWLLPIIIFQIAKSPSNLLTCSLPLPKSFLIKPPGTILDYCTFACL